MDGNSIIYFLRNKKGNKMPQEGIIERGKVSGEEEYQRFMKELGIQRFQTEDFEESFWGIPLNLEYFIFCNNLLCFLGHHITGRVGRHSKNIMLRKETVEYFIKIDEKGG